MLARSAEASEITPTMQPVLLLQVVSRSQSPIETLQLVLTMLTDAAVAAVTDALKCRSPNAMPYLCMYINLNAYSYIGSYMRYRTFKHMYKGADLYK